MLDLNAQIKFYCDDIRTIHAEIDPINLLSLSQEKLEEWEKRLTPIYQESLEFIQNNEDLIKTLYSKKDEESVLFQNHLTHCFTNLGQDLENIKFTLLFKSKEVNC